MYKLAIVGATSQIARDLILHLHRSPDLIFLLYARDIEKLSHWLETHKVEKRHVFGLLDTYGMQEHDVVINFIGVGSPSASLKIGSDILAVTAKYDDMILRQLKRRPYIKYIFISSGSVFGSNFSSPVDNSTCSNIDINQLAVGQYYSIAKLYAEAKHRALSKLNITDLRIFSYFSDTTDLSSRFFIADIISAIVSKTPLKVGDDEMTRDFIHIVDLIQIIRKILETKSYNGPIDCFSRGQIRKKEILQFFSDNYGLEYEITNNEHSEISNSKTKYYSVNHSAKNIGYSPKYSSRDVLEEFSKKILFQKIV